jgi:threonine synthase
MNKNNIMKYYSTNQQAPNATLHEAVVKGLASDRGLYMPERQCLPIFSILSRQ